MSLKIFHIVFVSISTIVLAGFGVWCLRAFFLERSGTDLALGVFSLVASLVLIVYGKKFYEKFKDWSNL
ncbi:MAG: hypothetical protein HY706_13590 [Candidatus Hydrogenedentes bacterium]|nr:hypothetical protein [Candidatus Hydrogenedentota bacterium]